MTSVTPHPESPARPAATPERLVYRLFLTVTFAAFVFFAPMIRTFGPLGHPFAPA